MVSYTLKESRFRSLHRDAVRWPAEDFKFVGTPVPPEAKGAQVQGVGKRGANGAPRHGAGRLVSSSPGLDYCSFFGTGVSRRSLSIKTR